MLLNCPEDAEFDGDDPHRDLLVFFQRVVVVSALAIFMVMTSWLLGRQTAGAFQPLSSAGALAVGMVAAMVVGLCRWGEWQTQKGMLASVSLINLLFTFAILLFAVAISFPRVAPLATLMLWLPVVGEEAVWWLCWFRSNVPATQVKTQFAARDSQSSVVALSPLDAEKWSPSPTQADDEETDEELQDEEEPELLPPCVTQQLTREQTAENGEYLYGLVRCKLAAGEQTQNVHVAFCPPLTSVPEIVVRQLEGPNATIKIGTAQTFGARFELRLAVVAAAAVDVILQFEARVNGS